MTHLKILGFAAIAATALMAFASTASATELTDIPGFMVHTLESIEAASEGHATLDSPIGNIQCNSSLRGITESTGSSTETVSGSGTVSFFNCTEGAVVKVLANGSLEIHTEGTTANGNGTLTSTGTEVTVEFRGFHCIFRTNSTDLGTVTGSRELGFSEFTFATLDINARIPAVGGRSGIFCGSTSPWTGSYVVTSPSPLLID